MAERVIETKSDRHPVKVLEWPDQSDSWYVEVDKDLDFSPNRFAPDLVQMDVDASYEGNNTFFIPPEALAEVLKKFGWTCSPPVRQEVQ